MTFDDFGEHCPEWKAIFEAEIAAGKASSLPLGWYLTFALDKIMRDQAAAPQQPDYFVVPKMLHFVRFARAHPAIAESSGTDALGAVIEAMHDMELDWKYLDHTNADEAEIDFLHHWETVRFPVGWMPLAVAAEQARKRPVRLRRPLNKLFGDFVSMAWHLQRLVRPGGTIFLPCRQVAEQLRCSHESVSRMRKRAMEAGYLIEKKKATYRGASGRSDATEFLFDLERFDTSGEEIL